jgi:hypothetical protein
MNHTLLNAINMEDWGGIASIMIEPQRQFVGDSKPYEVNLDKDLVDVERLLVRTDVWIKEHLEIDEFSKWVNRIMYILQNEADVELWDYKVCEYLESLGIDVEDENNGYTYNDPDYNRLDRDIHYTTFIYDGEMYVIFSVHYGADARVGFGENACFKVSDKDSFYQSMNISVYDKDDNDIEIWHVEDIATYNKEKDEWIHNETGETINVSGY